MVAERQNAFICLGTEMKRLHYRPSVRTKLPRHTVVSGHDVDDAADVTNKKNCWKAGYKPDYFELKGI